MKLTLLLFLVCLHRTFSDEIKLRVLHKGGDHLQKIVEQLHDLEISFELSKQGDIEAYLPEEQLSVLKNSNITHTQVPHESKEYHEELKRSTQGSLSSYHNYGELVAFMNEIADTYPGITKNESIGKSVQGRDILAMKISKNPHLNEIEPEFKFVGNMHGDETVGRECLINLIRLLCESYNNNVHPTELTRRITKLIDNTEIWIIPTMNPDGFERGTRANANNVDLNRNFPDLRFPGRQMSAIQPETQSLMDFINNHHFVLSANLHGGALVANYPYDGNYYRRSGIIEATPDHALFQFVSSTYASTHTTMSKSVEFKHGIINGAEWYVLYGGMQDYNYEKMGCMEITLELSDIKYPPVGKLDSYWDENKLAMISYMELTHIGVKGVVRDADDKPLEATIIVVERNHPVFTDPETGDYHRLLLPGTYTLRVSATGYKTQSATVVIPAKQKPFEQVKKDFVLVK